MADISKKGGTKGEKAKVSKNKAEHNDKVSKKKVVSKKCEKHKVESKKIIDKMKSKVVLNKQKTTIAAKKKVNSDILLDSNVTMDNATKQSKEANDSEWLNDNGSSTVVNEATVKHKEERIRERCKSWQLTREEITSVPTLIKPIIKPIDDKIISNMAEKMMKEIKDNQNSQKLKKTETPVDSKKEQTIARTSKQISGGVLKKKEGKFKMSKQCDIALQPATKKRDAATAQGKLIGSQMKKSSGRSSEAKTSGKSHSHLAQAKHLDKKSSQEAIENLAHHSSDKILENAPYKASNDKSCETFKHQDVLDEPQDNAEKSLKTMKYRFSVPLKKEIHDASSNNKTSRKPFNTETEPLHKVSSDSKTKVGDSKLQTTNVKKGKHLKSITGECQLFLPEYNINVIDYENTAKKSQNTLHPEYRKCKSIENKTIPYDSSKDISANIYNTSLKEESSSNSTKMHSNFRCMDGGDQRLDEIISFQQANEIIANSFAIESPNVKQRFEMNQDSDKVKPSSDEKQASPLVPRYVAESVQFLDIFKGVSPEREGKFKIVFQV